LLGDGHALQGEEFLGVGRAVGGDEGSFETSDFLEVFEAHDGEVGGRQAVAEGVAGGSGFAFRGAGAGGMGGVGAIGGKLPGGCGWFGFLGRFHGYFRFQVYHGGGMESEIAES
jgi:hypothetical protein